MDQASAGALMVEVGLVLLVLLAGRRLALSLPAAQDLPLWLRERELRREPWCRNALVLTIAVTVAGLVLLVLS